MATPSENSRLRNYFTLTDNEIICDFCFNSYDIIINDEDVKKHLVTHEGYKNVAFSFKKGDGKKYYTIHNNTIKCKLCKELYTSSNTHSIIKYHLEDGHKTNERKVEETNKWIREKYTLNESDATKQYCNQCKEGIQNKLVHLMSHLLIDHKDEDYLKYRPIDIIKTNRLDDIFDDWIWNYFIRNGEYAKCSICINKCDYKFLEKKKHKFRDHMKKKHEHIPPPLIKGSKLFEKKYTQIQDKRIKCNICYEEFDQAFYIRRKVRSHLEEVYDITCEQSEVLRKWVFKHVYKLGGFQNSQCKHCDKNKSKLQKMCVFDIFKHLIKDHRIETPPEISSMRVCKEFIDSLSSDENVKNIPTSSDPQPGSSKSSDIDVRDVSYDRDSRMENLKRMCRELINSLSSDEKVKNIPTSSDPQPGSSKSSDIELRDVNYDRDSRMENLKRLENLLDDIFDNWIWNYFIRNGEYAQCSICHKDYKFFSRLTGKIKTHMLKEHNISDVSLESNLSHKYFEIETVVCNICNTRIELTPCNHSHLQSHLKTIHEITSVQSEVLCEWVFNNIDKLRGFQKSNCKHCDKELKKMCVFDIFRHLVKNDGIKTPSEISSMKVCKEFIDSLSSDENVKNIPTSSDPQPGSSKFSDIDVRDVSYDRDSRMENLKRKSSSLLSSDKNVKYTATSSMDSQPGCSKFPDDHNSWMKRIKYDDDKRLSDELRIILSDPLEFAENPENLDVSHKFPDIEDLNDDSDD